MHKKKCINDYISISNIFMRKAKWLLSQADWDTNTIELSELFEK